MGGLRREGVRVRKGRRRWGSCFSHWKKKTLKRFPLNRLFENVPPAEKPDPSLDFKVKNLGTTVPNPWILSNWPIRLLVSKESSILVMVKERPPSQFTYSTFHPMSPSPFHLLDPMASFLSLSYTDFPTLW